MFVRRSLGLGLVNVRLMSGQGYLAGSGRAVSPDRHARLLALAEILSAHLNGTTSYRLAQAWEERGLDGRPLGVEHDTEDGMWLTEGLDKVTESRISFWTDELKRLADQGVWMVDTLDTTYPANLQMIHNRPPFLMVSGDLVAEDRRAMAIVGTRNPSEEGRKAAFDISVALAERGITIVSGLADGIDSAAHKGALSVGGRTVAVFGTGIEVVYPTKNRELAAQAARSGACVSQFWPRMRGAQWTFPARNIVTSGLSLGTVVVEASATSGARLQAEAALRHGKRVLLFRQLVDSQEWAKAIAERPEVVTVESVGQVIEAVDIEVASDTTSML
jgi:DNA processing protein